MARECYDAAVLGLGTMGAFTCLELARRGLSVIGLDQFTPPHDRGSHSGDTRVFRVVYAEHPEYVPLAQRAGQLWDRLGEEAGTVFLHRTGMINLGPEDSPLIAGIQSSAAKYGLEIEELPEEEIRLRFPAFHPERGWKVLFEPGAGWVDVNGCLRFALEQAALAGAELCMEARVESCRREGEDFLIRTTSGTVIARRLIVAAGAWSGRLLASLDLPLKVLRKVLVWVKPFHPAPFEPGVFPVFASAGEFFYGFPNIHEEGVKLAIHWSREPTPATDIDVPQPEVDTTEIQPVLEKAAQLLPSLAGPLPGALDRVIRAKTCLYTMTVDEHFIIDRHPHWENAYIAAGFSGHGFKFAPAIGEILTGLALDGTTPLPIDLFSLRRFGGPAAR